jgi:hypothetical protein
MPRSSPGCFGEAGKMDTTREGIKKAGRDCRKLGWILEISEWIHNQEFMNSCSQY